MLLAQTSIYLYTLPCFSVSHVISSQPVAWLLPSAQQCLFSSCMQDWWGKAWPAAPGNPSWKVAIRMVCVPVGALGALTS